MIFILFHIFRWWELNFFKLLSKLLSNNFKPGCLDADLRISITYDFWLSKAVGCLRFPFPRKALNTICRQVTLIPPNVTIFTFKQSQTTPVKTGDKEGKYKEVENNKQEFGLKQCCGTTKKQSKAKQTKQNQTPKLGSFWQGWTTKHSSKTIHYSSTEKSEVASFGHMSSGDNWQSTAPMKRPQFSKLCVWKSFKVHLVRGCPHSSLLELLGVKHPTVSTLELQFPWRCGGPLTGYLWGSCSSP